MPIPVYLAVKSEETVKHPKNFLAQVGFGFHPNGSVRFPRQLLPNVIAIIDDMYLPNFSNTALHLLKDKLLHGCILDFERNPGQLHKKLIQGLSGKKLIALPERYHPYAPQALPIISCTEPCNSWLQFVMNAQKSYPNGWMLEITPWNHERVGATNSAEGYLQNALCRFRRENENVLYYDTRETIGQKMSLAQLHGCKGVIALYAEVKNLK